MLSVFISQIKIRFPAGSAGRWVLSNLYRRPWSFLPALLRSLIATKKLTGNFLPLVVRVSPRMRIYLHKHVNASVVCKGSLLVEAWGNEEDRASLSIADGGRLELLGDFSIGPGVHISISRQALLRLGGRRHSTGSGITCKSRVMVQSSVEIGADTIIAWNVFITDSDWHQIQGQPLMLPVLIGDHVWISHDVSILKGAAIPHGCIVGAKSLVNGGGYPESALLAGVPAQVRDTDVQWSR
jgi:acetyltransferase-like isoleucine patch superfamily enzyme